MHYSEGEAEEESIWVALAEWNRVLYAEGDFSVTVARMGIEEVEKGGQETVKEILCDALVEYSKGTGTVKWDTYIRF